MTQHKIHPKFCHFMNQNLLRWIPFPEGNGSWRRPKQYSLQGNDLTGVFFMAFSNVFVTQVQELAQHSLSRVRAICDTFRIVSLNRQIEACKRLLIQKK